MTRYNKITKAICDFCGSQLAALLASLIIILWIPLGFYYGFSEGWQLFINTFTTIVTFLMVFIIQATNNKDTKAVQLKLNALMRQNKELMEQLEEIERD